jgi:hypothetical protein
MTPEKMPSLVDVGVILTGNNSHDVAQVLRRMFSAHIDLGTKCSQVKFGGRGGNHDTPVPRDLNQGSGWSLMGGLCGAQHKILCGVGSSRRIGRALRVEAAITHDVSAVQSV